MQSNQHKTLRRTCTPVKSIPFHCSLLSPSLKPRFCEWLGARMPNGSLKSPVRRRRVGVACITRSVVLMQSCLLCVVTRVIACARTLCGAQRPRGHADARSPTASPAARVAARRGAKRSLVALRHERQRGRHPCCRVCSPHVNAAAPATAPDTVRVPPRPRAPPCGPAARPRPQRTNERGADA